MDAHSANAELLSWIEWIMNEINVVILKGLIGNERKIHAIACKIHYATGVVINWINWVIPVECTTELYNKNVMQWQRIVYICDFCKYHGNLKASVILKLYIYCLEYAEERDAELYDALKNYSECWWHYVCVLV